MSQKRNQRILSDPQPRSSGKTGRKKLSGNGNVRAGAYPLIHGIYSDRFLNDEERTVYKKIVKQLRKDFSFNKSSDVLQVDLAASYYIKLTRALAQENYEALERLDRMFRSHLKGLKALRLIRENENNPETGGSPTEWATDLLEEARESEAKEPLHVGTGTGSHGLPLDKAMDESRV